MIARIKIPTFDAEVIFVFNREKDKVRKYVKKNFFVDIEHMDEDEYAGMTVDLDNMTWMIYLPDVDGLDLVELARTLSHEANHVVLQMMRKLGVEDDETICYCQDNILGEMLKKILKKKTNKK